MRPITEAQLFRRLGPAAEMTPEDARKIVWGGLHYARRNDFRPPECHARCARAAGADPGGVDPAIFGVNGRVHVMGDAEDLVARLARPRPIEDAMAEWDRLGFVFTVGSKTPW